MKLIRTSFHLTRDPLFQDGWKSVRRFAALVMGLVGLAILSVLLVVLYRYNNRPLFSNNFGAGDRELLPNWHQFAFRNDWQVAAFDYHKNQIVLIETVAIPEGVHNAPPWWMPVANSREAIWSLPDGRKIKVEAENNMLIRFLKDGSVRRFPLVPGRARKIGEDFNWSGADYKQLFADDVRTASSPL